ncbi:hypothetical protein [Ectothiorhodospira shaposhnikovii]|uniref:hypothetical protein n=1 Tax=Ectothiorhodospira shaposhnikovii TaxID=1054 RepID=UPI001F5B9237|nr:hypothetical protein [Ectothiorhodospira shaposhnikovii]
MMGGWGCPHESKGLCHKVENRPCEPGMKGCVLAGRFVFSDAHKNTRRVLRDKLGRRQQKPAT